MPKKDFYELLGIDHSATREEIRKAYRRMAHLYHPDKNPENPAAEEFFKQVNQAYETLGDIHKRAVYDRTRSPWGRRSYEGFEDLEDRFPGRSAFEEVVDDFLGDFFGVRRERTRRSRGADLFYTLEISLEDAAWGATREIKVQRTSSCPVCRGSRCTPGTSLKTCPVCRGHGSVRTQRGFFVMEMACERCEGRGKIIVHPCPKCGGKGRAKVTRILRIDIPPGVDQDSRLRLAGEGEMGRNGGAFGDLFLLISIRRHPVFTRAGSDILCEIGITRSQAVNGAEVEIPVLGGKATLKVPPETPSGKTFVLKEMGMPGLQGQGRGDQRVKVRIVE